MAAVDVHGRAEADFVVLMVVLVPVQESADEAPPAVADVDP
ncbi:hypothetical protein QFZ40_003842 [Arthrobacter pascens]|nr:hypothetical protein [Arthrobacter pascens]MDQ0635933.1 hypothetical protein [Arthrobacter pascens]